MYKCVLKTQWVKFNMYKNVLKNQLVQYQMYKSVLEAQWVKFQMYKSVLEAQWVKFQMYKSVLKTQWVKYQMYKGVLKTQFYSCFWLVKSTNYALNLKFFFCVFSRDILCVLFISNFIPKKKSKACRTLSQQVKNGIFGCRWFLLFIIDFQLFYFLTRIMPDYLLTSNSTMKSQN